MNLVETFNADKLAYIIKNKDAYIPLLQITDVNYKPFSLPEKYLYKSENGQCNTQYKFGKGTTDGRLFAEGGLSLQSFCREIRHTIANEYYCDIDIVNCHPVILYHLCVKHDIKCEFLKLYIDNREAIIADILKINPDMTRDDIKDIFISIQNGGIIPYQSLEHKTKFIECYMKEMKNIVIDMYNKYCNDVKVKATFNKAGKTINRVFCVEENKILKAILEYFNVSNGDNAVLCFDGVMLPKGDYDLAGCQAHVLETTGYDIKLKIKDMNDGFVLPDDIPEFDKDSFEWSLGDSNLNKLFVRDITDYSIAEYIFNTYKNDFVYNNGMYYHWTGKHWHKSDTTNDIINLINGPVYDNIAKAVDIYFDNLELPDEKARGKTHSRIDKLKNYKQKEGIIKEFNVLITHDGELFDMRPELLGFANGIYDTDADLFRPAVKEDYVSLIVPYDYEPVPDEDMVDFMKFIDSVMPVEAERDFFLKAVSSTLRGQTLENILIMTGNGRNGKDTVLSYLLRATLGEDLFYYNSNTVITGTNQGGVNQEKCNMHLKRAVVYSEPNKDTTLKNNTLKEISGGKQINARGLYSSNTKTILHATNIILCNDIPALDNIDDAISQRLYVIPFRSLFRKKEDIEKLPEGTQYVYKVNSYYKEDKFLKENKMKFMWLLLKYFRLFKADGYILKGAPASIVELSKAYMSDSDDFNCWLLDKYTKTDNKNDVVKLIDLFASFIVSDLYTNMTKKEKRAMTKKKFEEMILSNPNIRPYFRERAKVHQVNYKKCIVGFKIDDNKNENEDHGLDD